MAEPELSTRFVWELGLIPHDLAHCPRINLTDSHPNLVVNTVVSKYTNYTHTCGFSSLEAVLISSALIQSGLIYLTKYWNLQVQGQIASFASWKHHGPFSLSLQINNNV